MGYRSLPFLLSLCAIASLGDGLSAQAQTTTTFNEPITTSEISSSEISSPECPPDRTSQRIQLFYYRQATNIVKVLNAVSSLEKCLVIANYSEDSIILSGPEKLIKQAYRVIASIDLPLTGIDMQMWGIQISSHDPQDLAEVMSQIREEINLTQQLLRDTFVVLKQSLRNLQKKDNSEIALDSEFLNLIEELGYQSFVNVNRPLSLIDVVLSGNAIVGSEALKFNQVLYDKLMMLMQKDQRYEKYLAAMKEKGRPPFDRFFRSRGLKPKCITYEEPKKQEKCKEWKWFEISPGAAENYVKISRRIMLEFALQYGDFITNPNQFSPYELQQTSNALNDHLQDTTDALNKDIEDFFVGPTLDKIQDIVSRFGNVSYAQVGRTTIGSLNGIETTVESSSISAFDVTPFPKLSELLDSAESLSQQISPFIPTETQSGETESTELTVDGDLPISRAIGLIAAFSEQEAKYRELNTGVTLTFTPNVLRNMNSAELKIDLTIADPVATGTASEGVKPLSRIGQQTVKTTVYTEAVDFFALSTFSNQSTLDGGRGYVPIVGWIWKGIFSAIPGFGELFSWKKGPKNVLHESLLLTNSYITPTSMGLALLYPIVIGKALYNGLEFCNRQYAVKDYIAKQFGEVYQRNRNDNRCGYNWGTQDEWSSP